MRRPSRVDRLVATTTRHPSSKVAACLSRLMILMTIFRSDKYQVCPESKARDFCGLFCYGLANLREINQKSVELRSVSQLLFKSV
jgi:hypothetical protein